MPAHHLPPEDLAAAKAAWRDRLTAARARVPLARLVEESALTAGHLVDLPQVRDAATVSAYVSVGHEPGTGLLIEALHQRGVRVLLPLVRPERVLDWAAYDGPQSLAPARFGLLEPTTTTLGADAIGAADAVLVPALAVDPRGVRIGKGGGYYDRALTHVAATTFTCAILRDDEIGLDLPTEPHDRAVGWAASPTGVRELPLA